MLFVYCYVKMYSEPPQSENAVNNNDQNCNDDTDDIQMDGQNPEPDPSTESRHRTPPPGRKVSSQFEGSGISVRDAEHEMDMRRNSGGRTVVSLIFQQSTESATKREREVQRKNDLCFAWTMLLSMLYGITVILVGVAFPITEALRHEWLTSQTVAVFNVYCDGMAIAFLIYLTVCLWHDKKSEEDILSGKSKSKDEGKSSKDLVIHLKKEPKVNDLPRYGYDNPSCSDVFPDDLSGRDPLQRAFEPFRIPNCSGHVLKSFKWNRSASQIETPRLRRAISAEANLCDYGVDMRPGMDSDNSSKLNGPIYSVLDSSGPASSVAGDSFRGPFQESMAGFSLTSGGPVMLPLSDDIYEKIMILRQTATLSHDSASFYLRLGALLFGIGNFVYVCVQIEFYVVEVTGKCDDVPVVYPMFLHLIFLIIQTFFIFKNTKVHIRRRKGLARFGFAHVLATNMCIWLRILVMEVMDGIHDGLEHDNQNSSHAHAEVVESQFFEAHHKNVTYCMHQDGLFLTSAPYLFPFVLEYSLIAVAVMAGMYHALNIRVSQDILQAIKKAVKNNEHPNKHQDHEQQLSPVSCESGTTHSLTFEEKFFAKSHRGLYLGAIVLTGTILGVIMFFNFSNRNQKGLAMEIYYLTDIVLHLILIPPVIYAFHVFRQFRFTFNRDNTIDHILLLVSLCGIVIYYIFILLTTASYLSFDAFDNIDDVITAMSMTAAVLNITQSLIQGLFVIAGLQTCAVSEEQEKRKPGRGVITFLIVGNIALWIFKTLQVKETGLNRFAEFYGITAWPIIVNTNLPLALFYRFHASVCLADMWTSAYKPEEGPKCKQIL